MKHYLDLVPISVKIHRKQSRMSIFCIVLAVFLVTTIFGMADMFVRSQILQTQQEYGNWHIAIKNISNEEASIIASRPDVKVFSPYGVLNYRGDLGYTLGGKNVAICGCDKSYITEIWAGQLEDGVFPQASNEALVTENVKQIMGVAIGDSIAVETPDGDKLNFTISGFMNNTDSIMSGDSYGIILNIEDYCAIYPNVSDGEPNDYGIMFFTQFTNTRNIQGKIADLKKQCNLSNEQISSNNNLLGLLGQSRVPFLLQVYLAAAVLFVLVMLAGIMMIASSLNSNVAQRTEFFGLMRCIGATPKQVMRLVRKEEWKALIAQYPKIPKAEAELKSLLPIYEDKAKEATGKLSLFNKIQKEIERLTQLKDKAVKDEAAYESKASTILNNAQESTSICATKLAEHKALTTNLISQEKNKKEAYEKALQAWNNTKKEMEEWQAQYQQILNGEEPDAAEQRLTAAKDEATKAADDQNENINKLKAELANSKGSHQTMLSQDKTMKENLQAKEKELDLWIEEYNKQLEEKSIEPRFIERNTIREMLHSAEDWNAIRREKDEKEKAVASTTALYQSAEKGGS